MKKNRKKYQLELEHFWDEHLRTLAKQAQGQNLLIDLAALCLETKQTYNTKKTLFFRERRHDHEGLMIKMGCLPTKQNINDVHPDIFTVTNVDEQVTYLKVHGFF